MGIVWNLLKYLFATSEFSWTGWVDDDEPDLMITWVNLKKSQERIFVAKAAL